VIRVVKVSHAYNGQQVLSDISLCLETGQVHGFVGNNGSGKTLLFKVICGYLRPDKGQVFFGNQQLGRAFDFPPRLGMILETPGFLNTLSAVQNLSLLWSLRGKPDYKAIENTLQRVGLAHTGRKKVGKFSMGMRQRLGIAQAIMESPALLILDEPFNGLDKQGVADIRQLLKEQKQRGATILLASHMAGDIEELCDTVHEMDAGRLRRIN
jgi:ABC-2 type transport system ATP-binding protein